MSDSAPRFNPLVDPHIEVGQSGSGAVEETLQRPMYCQTFIHQTPPCKIYMFMWPHLGMHLIH